MLLELPVFSTTPEVVWQTEWAPGSDDARLQVLQSLSEYAANFKQLRPLLDVWAEPGSAEREKLAQRLGKALACMDSSSFAGTLFDCDKVRLPTCIRSH
jgi:hypothetical protein